METRVHKYAMARMSLIEHARVDGKHGHQTEFIHTLHRVVLIIYKHDLPGIILRLQQKDGCLNVRKQVSREDTITWTMTMCLKALAMGSRRHVGELEHISHRVGIVHEPCLLVHSSIRR